MTKLNAKKLSYNWKKKEDLIGKGNFVKKFENNFLKNVIWLNRIFQPRWKLRKKKAEEREQEFTKIEKEKTP